MWMWADRQIDNEEEERGGKNKDEDENKSTDFQLSNKEFVSISVQRKRHIGV